MCELQLAVRLREDLATIDNKDELLVNTDLASTPKDRLLQNLYYLEVKVQSWSVLYSGQMKSPDWMSSGHSLTDTTYDQERKTECWAGEMVMGAKNGIRERQRQLPKIEPIESSD